MRDWVAEFQCAEVRGAAGEVFVDGRDHNARVHGFAICLQREVQIHGMVNGVAIKGVGWRQLLEDVEVDLNGVALALTLLKRIAKLEIELGGLRARRPGA